MAQLLGRNDDQIHFLEMLAVVLMLSTFEDLLAQKAVYVFIDNNGVLGSLIKGSSKAPEVNLLVGRVWLHAAKWAWAPIWARVESEANIADGPSRRDFVMVGRLGAVWVKPRLPNWLMTLWITESQVECV